MIIGSDSLNGNECIELDKDYYKLQEWEEIELNINGMVGMD